MELKSEEITDTLVETEAYTIQLFDQETLRIDTGKREVFVDIEDADMPSKRRGKLDTAPSPS